MPKDPNLGFSWGSVHMEVKGTPKFLQLIKQ